MGMLLISHDMSVVAERCESISVMWQGAIVEAGANRTVINSPRHPFTAELVRDVTHPPQANDRPAQLSSEGPAGDPPTEAGG